MLILVTLINSLHKNEFYYYYYYYFFYKLLFILGLQILEWDR